MDSSFLFSLRIQYVIVETGIWCSPHQFLQVWQLERNSWIRPDQRLDFSSLLIKYSTSNVLMVLYQNDLAGNRYG